MLAAHWPSDFELALVPVLGICLSDAAAMGDLKMCRLLVSQGAICELKSGYCESALWSAVSGGHVEVVRYLLQAGANDTRMKVHRSIVTILLSTQSTAYIAS